MKLRAKDEIAIMVDDTYGVIGYIHQGEEVNVFPTDDGMKFEAFGKRFTPYDFAGMFEVVD